MKRVQISAAALLAALILAGCVDEGRGYSGYSGYSGGYYTDDYRPSYRERRRWEARRDRSERRQAYDRREERVYRDRVNEGIDYRDDNQGPNIIRLPANNGGY